MIDGEMVKAFIYDVDYVPNGKRRVVAILQWGGAENLNPKDLGLYTIDSIQLTAQAIRSINQPIAMGSVQTVLGSQNPGGGNIFFRGGGIGSTVLLRWAQGSSGTRLATAQNVGTISLGTKTAHAIIYGQTT